MSESVNALIAQGGVQQGQNPLGMVSNVIDMARGAQTLKAQQFALQQAQLQPAYSSLMALRDNPNASYDDINSALAQSKRVGANVDGLVTEVTDRTARGEKPADIIRAMSLRGMPAAVQAEMMMPGRVSLNTGAGTVFGTTGAPGGAQPGVFTPSGFVGSTLTPEQWATPTTITDPKTGQQTEVPFGQKWGIPMPTGLGGSSGGGGGGGVTGSALLPPGAAAEVAAARIDQIAQRESGNQNIPTAIKNPDGSPASTASGPYQFLDSTWQQAAREYGIQNLTPRAMQTDPAIQRAVAIKFLQTHGETPWAQSAPQGQGGGGGTVAATPGGSQGGAFIGATTTQPGGIQYFSPTGQPMGQGGGGAGGGATSGRSYALPPPGQVSSIEAAADASTKQYTGDNAAAGQFNQRLWPLVNAQHIIETQGATTGPGAAAARDIIGHLQTLSSIFTPADLQTIGQAKFEELNKYLTQAVNAQPMAQQSDARLASAITGNPSAHISTMANADILKAMIGLERMKQAAITDFNNQGGQPKDYANFLRQWQTTHDPRAFVFDMLSPEARQKMVNGMNPTERQNFATTLTFLQNNPGLLTRAAMP